MWKIGTVTAAGGEAPCAGQTQSWLLMGREGEDGL